MRAGGVRAAVIVAVMAAATAASARPQGASPPPAAAAAPAPASSPSPGRSCKIGLIGELKLEVVDNKPLLNGAINGQPVRILVDTGSFTSMLFTDKARELHLALQDVRGLKLSGVGGVSTARSAYLDELDIAGVKRKGFRILVGGENAISAFSLIIGQDLMGRYDLEFDFRNGVMRFLTDSGCTDNDMAYWAKGAYSVAKLTEAPDDKIGLQVKLNGRAVDAILDTGASTSVATLSAADAARVKVEETGRVSQGIGALKVATKVGVLDTFQVGDEVIRNARLRFSDLFGAVQFTETGSHIGARPTDLPRMLLGADFLKAHRILISRTRHAAYFTYEGGPVFEAPRRLAPAASSPSAPPAGGAPAASPAPGGA